MPTSQVRAPHQSLQQRAVLVADIAAAAPAVAVERRLDLVPDLVVDDALVLALIDLAAVIRPCPGRSCW